MIYLKTVILGLVEGLTEFLPVSSTAHLILAGRLLQIPQSEYWKFFEVFVQSGAILAVVAAFFRELKNWRTIRNLLASFIPTAVTGFLLYGVIKSVLFESVGLILFTLVFFGVIFLIIERLVDRGKLSPRKKLEELSIKEAVIVGVFQSTAIIPGVSRSGAVLIGGLLMGYRRRDAALYSFLLAVPTILAASFFDLVRTDRDIFLANIPLSALGFVTAFITAYAVVRWFIRYLQNHSLKAFGWYRIILGGLLYLLFFGQLI